MGNNGLSHYALHRCRGRDFVHAEIVVAKPRLVKLDGDFWSAPSVDEKVYYNYNFATSLYILFLNLC